jgi:hypothetical protein
MVAGHAAEGVRLHRKVSQRSGLGT